MEQLVISPIHIINGYLQPSAVLVKNSRRYKNYEIIYSDNLSNSFFILGKKVITDISISNQNNTILSELIAYKKDEIFKEIYNLGKKLFNILEDILKGREFIVEDVYQSIINKNLVFLDDRFPKQYVEKVKPVLLKWVLENGLPFIENVKDNTEVCNAIYFIDRSICIYLFYQILTQNKENIYSVLKIMECMEKNLKEPSIRCFEKLEFFKEFKGKYKIIRYYDDLISVALHRLKYEVIKKKEKINIRVCEICGELYDCFYNGEKYCEHCKQESKNNKYNSYYNKMLFLHQELVNNYNFNMKDKEIEEIIYITSSREIKRLGIKKLEKLLFKVKKFSSL